MGAQALHAKRDPRETTQAARDGLKNSFLQQAIEAARANGEHPSPEEIERRAGKLRELHFTRLAYASHKARQAKKAGK